VSDSSSTTTPTPAQYALGLALESLSSSNTTNIGPAPTVGPPDPTAVPGADPCWYVGGHVGQRDTFTEAGQPVAWIEKDHGYWCGNGSSITGNGMDFYHGQWVQFPWCLNITNDLHGWDAPNYAWAHGGIWAEWGLTTPWATCGTYGSGHAVVRIAGNGYWDTYDDYGF
jgi:hypothetical protein